MSTEATTESRPEASGFIAFRSRDFRLFIAASFLAGAAMQMENIAVGWLVYQVTHSALALGLLGLTVFLPSVFLILVTGQVADRLDRRNVLIAGYAVIALASTGLALYAAAGASETWPVYVFIGAIGTARAFTAPANQALVPNLVPPEHLGNAISWRASSWQTASIAGPGIGGLLLALSPVLALAVTAAAFVATLFLVAAIATRPVPAQREPITIANVLAGIAFIRSTPVVLGAMSLDLFSVLLGGASALLPIYATDILGIGPTGLGALRAAPALGGIAMALALARYPLGRRAGRRMLQAIATYGLATIGFGLSTNLLLSLSCLFALGAADMVNVFVRQVIVQGLTPDAMRGRVTAVSTLFVGASNELGEFESGALAAAVGVVPSVVIGGVGAVFIATLWGELFPALRDRDRLIE